MQLDDLTEMVEIEFEDLVMVAGEIAGLLVIAAGRDPTVVERTAAGAFLAQFYGGIESVLKRFVKNLGGRMPVGEAWHLELARMFLAESVSGMPVLFTHEQFSIVAEFRKCRHAVRNCYVSPAGERGARRAGRPKTIRKNQCRITPGQLLSHHHQCIFNVDTPQPLSNQRSAYECHHKKVG